MGDGITPTSLYLLLPPGESKLYHLEPTLVVSLAPGQYSSDIAVHGKSCAGDLYISNETGRSGRNESG